MPFRSRRSIWFGLFVLVLAANAGLVRAADVRAQVPDQPPPAEPVFEPADSTERIFAEIRNSDAELSSLIASSLAAKPLSDAPQEARDFIQEKSEWASKFGGDDTMAALTWTHENRLTFQSGDALAELGKDTVRKKAHGIADWIKGSVGTGSAPKIKTVPSGHPEDDKLKDADFCMALMLQAARLEGKSDTPYSDADLAIIALGVKCNNSMLAARRLFDMEVYLLAVQVNVVAEKYGFEKIDSETLDRLNDLSNRQELRQEWDRFDQNISNYQKDAPEDFKRKVEKIMSQAVYRSPWNR